MSFYENIIFPPLLDLVMKQELMTRSRRRLIPQAEGRVLEIGFGSGLNLPFYDSDRINGLFGLEPNRKLQGKARQRYAALPETAGGKGFEFEVIGLDGQSIPLERGSVDTVVMTWVLCSIPDPVLALGEVRRVLKPGGRLLFVEHGRAPDAAVARWQDRLNPWWRPLAAGCNMNRRPVKLIQQAGLSLGDVEEEYLPGPRILSYQSLGTAGV